MWQWFKEGGEAHLPLEPDETPLETIYFTNPPVYKAWLEIGDNILHVSFILAGRCQKVPLN